jgi:hypothetical protein
MIRLHIERLVLDGVDVASSDSSKVRAAMEHELSRLIADHGLSPEMRTGGTMPSVKGGDIRLQPGAAPAKLGRQVAAGVYGGIGRERP